MTDRAPRLRPRAGCTTHPRPAHPSTAELGLGGTPREAHARLRTEARRDPCVVHSLATTRRAPEHGARHACRQGPRPPDPQHRTGHMVARPPRPPADGVHPPQQHTVARCPRQPRVRRAVARARPTQDPPARPEGLPHRSFPRPMRLTGVSRQGRPRTARPPQRGDAWHAVRTRPQIVPQQPLDSLTPYMVQGYSCRAIRLHMWCSSVPCTTRGHHLDHH